MDSELTAPRSVFSILTICTGNLVRSALTAQLLRARLASVGDFIEIASAGTGAAAGDRMPAQAEQLSLTYGGDPSGHLARLVTGEMMSSADLVLTATREQRAVVVSLFPRAARFTFTLRQFARLMESLDEDALRAAAASGPVATAFAAVAAAAAAQRGYLPPPDDPAADDIDDPYLQSQEVYDTVGAAVDAAVGSISEILLAVTPPQARSDRAD